MLVLCYLVTVAHGVGARPISPALEAADTIARSKLFQNTSQVDVVTVLMLLGEATIWKAIWGRLRSRHFHWRQFAFAISPGWTPLAANIFATTYGSLGPSNLVFDKPPEACIDDSLILTNLNSGASHAADNTIIQNIWHTWDKGVGRQTSSQRSEHMFDLTRDVGLADVNLDLLNLESPALFWLQSSCLAVQLIGSLIFGSCGWSFEMFIALSVAWLAQILLLMAIVPRQKAWTKTTRGHRPCAIMLHKGLDTMAVLIVRTTWSSGRQVSLEEFCWDNQASKDFIDKLKPLAAACSFLLWIVHVILVGWMSSRSRYAYLLLGGLGLATNTIEAAAQPRWKSAFQSAFSHHNLCAPLHSSLMSAVAILLAGKFPGAKDAAKLLYPDNARFKQSLDELVGHLEQCLCENCRHCVRFSCPREEKQCIRIQENQLQDQCVRRLDSRIRILESKQLADGLATVYNYLRAIDPNGAALPGIETRERIPSAPRHAWDTN